MIARHDDQIIAVNKSLNDITVQLSIVASDQKHIGEKVTDMQSKINNLDTTIRQTNTQLDEFKHQELAKTKQHESLARWLKIITATLAIAGAASTFMSYHVGLHKELLSQIATQAE